MPGDGFRSDLAREVAPDVLARFLRYVRIDTQSDYESDTCPSTAKQLDLGRLLVTELLEIGLEDARLDEHGMVLATIPATAEAPTIGLIAHMDTSPEASGTGVEPIVHRGYNGGEIVLPGDPRQILGPAEFAELADHAGHDLVTSDGTTLLGADDKAGVAEIVAATAYLVRHPELAHGPVRIAFTPDEEVGRGTTHFDIEAFGALAAYTLDGSTAGEVQDETFSACEVKVTFRGVSVHTGTAKGVLVNALKLAAEFVSRLPKDHLSPETTEGREGFVHPHRIHGNGGETVLTLIARDHDFARLEGHVELLRHLATEVAADVHIEIHEQYRNMKDFLGEESPVVEAAVLAVERAGLTPLRTLIRGGTDGSRLTEKGLPTPNLFTGGHNYHGQREWVCVQDMAAAVETIVHLVQIWAEPRTGAALQSKP